MSLVELFVPTEVAHDTVHELGELGNVQFKDVSTSQPRGLVLLIPTGMTQHTLPLLVEPKRKPLPALFCWRN